VQIFHGGAGGADTRENDAIGFDDAVRAVGDFGFMAEEFEGVLDAGEVARFVVDDCDHGWVPRWRS
jgi:hypothetical protein